MRLHKIILAIIAATPLTLGAQTDAITEAMMNVYNQMITSNPNDYEAYFRRANEYYRNDQYLRALSDIDQAIKLTPANEADLRYDELILRSNIYQCTDKLPEALADLEAALVINPNEYVAIYQKANVEYELGQYDAAKADYRRLQRINPRSVEGLFGQARVAVKERNYGLANELADMAVNYNPSESDVYLRRASIRRELGNNPGAVDDLILAVSAANSDGRALRELVAMSATDYPSVNSGLSSAVRQAPRVGMYRFIRAKIAQAHHHYADAIADYRALIDEGLYDSPSIYNSLAQCELALAKYAQASADAEYAIGATNDNAPYYATLAAIRRAQWRADDALTAADQALAKDATLNEALLEKSLALIDLNRYQEASDVIGEAIFNDGETPYYLLLRADLLANQLNQPGSAKIYTNRVLDLPDESPESLRGFALLANSQTDEAKQWIDQWLQNAPDNDGRVSYLGACLYAHAGDTDRALSLLRQAVNRGYSNIHQLTRDTYTNVNVAPLRDLPDFDKLVPAK